MQVVKYMGKIFWGKISQGGGKFGGRISKKKMKTYKFPSKNEYMYEVSSKSENGKMVKFRGNIFWGGGKFKGGIFNKEWWAKM